MSVIVNRYLCGLILCIGLIGTVALPAVARAAPLFDVRLTANSESTEIVLALAQPAAFHGQCSQSAQRLAAHAAQWREPGGGSVSPD